MGVKFKVKKRYVTLEWPLLTAVSVIENGQVIDLVIIIVYVLDIKGFTNNCECDNP